MKELHDAARDAYLLWKHSGKHRQGVVYELMRHSRSQFKHSLRVCKNRKNTIIADKITANVCNKDDRAFWGEIKTMTNSKIKLPSMVGNAHGDANNTMCQEHYSNTFSSVKGSGCRYIHAAICMEHIVFDRDMIVSSTEIEDIIVYLVFNRRMAQAKASFQNMKGILTNKRMSLEVRKRPAVLH